MQLPLNLVMDAFGAHLANWDLQRFDGYAYITFRAQRKALVPGAINVHYEMPCSSQCSNEEYVRQKLTLMERRLVG